MKRAPLDNTRTFVTFSYVGEFPTQCEKKRRKEGRREKSVTAAYLVKDDVKPGPIKFSASTQLFVIRKMYFSVYSCIFLYIRTYSYISQNEVKKKIYEKFEDDFENTTSEKLKCL